MQQKCTLNSLTWNLMKDRSSLGKCNLHISLIESSVQITIMQNPKNLPLLLPSPTRQGLMFCLSFIQKTTKYCK